MRSSDSRRRSSTAAYEPPAAADDDQERDESREEGEARRADGYTDRDSRCAVAHEKHTCTCPDRGRVARAHGGAVVVFVMLLLDGALWIAPFVAIFAFAFFVQFRNRSRRANRLS